MPDSDRVGMPSDHRRAFVVSLVSPPMSETASKDNVVMGAEGDRDRFAWRRGAGAGFVASVVMGLAITAVDLTTLRQAIAGLYGFEGNLVAGWLTHVAHGTVFGVVFAFVLLDPGVAGITSWIWKTTLAGIVYGVVLAVAGAGIIMPIWLGVVGFAGPPSIPYVTRPMLVWHALYGAVLGFGVALAERRPELTRS